MANIADIMDPLGSSTAAPTADAGDSPLQPGEASLLDPSGKPMAFPAHLVPSLLQQGYQQDTPENRTQAALRAKYGSGVGNMALAGAAGVASGATLGLSEGITPEAQKALKEYNPISSGVGQAVGAIGSAFVAPELSPVGRIAKIGAGAAEALGGSAVARAAGTGIEGAFYGLGQTASEVALGDPDLTAQKVVANVGLGALLGVVGHGVFQGIAGLGRKALGSGEGALGKFNNYLLGTPESDTAYYMANHAAVNAAPEVGAIKDALDHHVASVESAFNDSKLAYENSLADVKALQPDNALVTDLHAAMDKQKEVLGQLSQKLDATLDSGNVAIPVADVQAMINKQVNNLKINGSVAFGAERSGAIKYLEGLSDQLSESPNAGNLAEQLMDKPGTLAALQEGPGMLRGSALRDVVRSLREDGASAYGLGAGEFSAGKAREAQALAEGLNQYIHKDSTASAILKDMQARTTALKDMRPYFGAPESALSSLQQAAGNSAKNELRTQALAEFDKATGNDFIGRLKPYQDTSHVLASMKAGASAPAAIASIAHPSPELQALAVAGTAHEANAANWDAVKRLSAGRTQSLIESYMQKTAKAGEGNAAPKFSLEDTTALNHLASLPGGHPELGGQGIYSAMRARGVLDRFGNSKANGSRNAFIMGSLGGGIGGVIGGPTGALAGENLGALAGGAIDRSGGMAAKKIMDAVKMAQKAGNHGVTEPLGQFVLNKLGPAAIAGMKASSIAEILHHLQVQNSDDPRQEQRARSLGQLERHSNTTKARMHDGVQRFFKGGEVELRPQHGADVNDTITDIQKLAGNPQELMDRVHAQTASLSDMAPKVTAGINDTAVRAVQYLASKTPPSSHGFALDGAPPARSKAQLAQFQTALDTVNDPLSVLKHAKEGTLTGAHREALGAVYPALHAEIKAHAMNELVNHEAASLPFSKKTALSKLVGTPLVRQLAQPEIASAQAGTNAAVAQDQAAQAPQGAVKPSQKGLSKLSAGTRAQTDFQQSASRRGDS